MTGMDGALATPAGTATDERGDRSVQCSRCGHVQDLDPDYPICLNCGNAVGDGDNLILKYPRRGRGMQGLSIIAFLLFLFVFFFWSKYLGRHGMAVSALFYIWGFYRNYLHKRSTAEEYADPGKP